MARFGPHCLLLLLVIAHGFPGQDAQGPKGIVTCASAPATDVGIRVLRDGGNAVDAAAAVGLAMAVTYPTAGNLGGGGFMVIRMNDGRTAAIDFRETAPAAARKDMYLDSRGERIPKASTVGYRAVGVPGTVAGLALARERYGRLPWARLVEPAESLASDGFAISDALAASLRNENVLSLFPESRRIFQRNGNYYRAGDGFKQPELGETLRRLRQYGPREFYEGETARLIAADMAANGGLITRGDLKRYRAVLRKPLIGTYRGYEIITMPPPSSGGAALISMFNMLEHLDGAALRSDTAERAHLLVEAMRRAFADRAKYLGDPDFVTVPVAGLVSKQYAKQRAIEITERASAGPDVQAGSPLGYESPQTTHYSVVDAAGNAAAVTYTLNSGYGSGAAVKGAGFLLNNEMDDFTSRPGLANQFGLIQGDANAIAPRKRPLSSMTPTIVVRNGKLFLVLGSPGGPTIINTVLQVLTNEIDLRMSLRDAVAAPRIHHQWLPNEIAYERRLPESVISALKAKGHSFKERPGSIGDVQAIMVTETGVRSGVSDPRSADGRAAAE